jgi:hypothetical protein
MKEILNPNSLYNFFLNEDNLEKLTLDRSLKIYEIFEPNDYYGQALVLKNYLKLPKFYSFKATLEHGIEFNEKLI